MPPIVPQGLPAWLRANDFEAYGGDLNKKNFASRGVINPKTDVGAEAFSRMTADLAALTRTAPFCVMVVRNNDSGGSPLPPTVTYIAMMTGTQVAAYDGNAPPPGFPLVEYTDIGVFTVTFDVAYEDEFGVSGDLVITQPAAQLLGALPGFATVEVMSTTQVRVHSFDNTGGNMMSTSVSLTIGSGG